VAAVVAVVVAAVMVVVMAVVVVLVCGGGGGGGDAKLRCPGGREVSPAARVRSPKHHQIQALGAHTEGHGQPRLRAPSDWSAYRRARSTETAASATPDRVVNVTEVKHTVHLKELRLLQTPDTIRGTNGMNSRVRADAALYL
jgi:hypothetical protein